MSLRKNDRNLRKKGKSWSCPHGAFGIIIFPVCCFDFVFISSICVSMYLLIELLPRNVLWRRGKIRIFRPQVARRHGKLLGRVYLSVYAGSTRTVASENDPNIRYCRNCIKSRKKRKSKFAIRLKLYKISSVLISVVTVAGTFFLDVSSAE